MAIADFTLRNEIKTALDAEEAISHAAAMVEFLQEVLTLNNTGGDSLSAPATTGLYYIMDGIVDKLKNSSKVFSELHKDDKTA